MSGLPEWTLAKLPAVRSGAYEKAGISRERFVARLTWMRSLLTFNLSNVYSKRSYTALSNALEALNLDDSDGTIRPQPYGVVLSGDPGCGKSGTAIKIAISCLKAKYGHAHPDEIVTLNETDEFQSEFRSHHKVVIFDDLGADRASINDTKNPWRKIVDFINNIRKTALNPNVDMKGNVYIDPDLVIVTTNRNENLSVGQWMYYPDAIYRRFAYFLAMGNDRKTATICKRPHNGNLRVVWEENNNDDLDNIIKMITFDFQQHHEDQQQFIRTVNDRFDVLPKRGILGSFYFDMIQPFVRKVLPTEIPMCGNATPASTVQKFMSGKLDQQKNSAGSNPAIKEVSYPCVQSKLITPEDDGPSLVYSPSGEEQVKEEDDYDLQSAKEIPILEAQSGGVSEYKVQYLHKYVDWEFLYATNHISQILHPDVEGLLVGDYIIYKIGNNSRSVFGRTPFLGDIDNVHCGVSFNHQAISLANQLYLDSRILKPEDFERVDPSLDQCPQKGTYGLMSKDFFTPTGSPPVYPSLFTIKHSRKNKSITNKRLEEVNLDLNAYCSKRGWGSFAPHDHMSLVHFYFAKIADDTGWECLGVEYPWYGRIPEVVIKVVNTYILLETKQQNLYNATRQMREYIQLGYADGKKVIGICFTSCKCKVITNYKVSKCFETTLLRYIEDVLEAIRKYGPDNGVDHFHKYRCGAIKPDDSDSTSEEEELSGE